MIIMSVLRSLLFTLILVEFVKGAPVSDPANNNVVGQVETNTIGEWTQSDDDLIGENSQPLEGSGHLYDFEHDDTESDDKEVSDNPIEDSREVDGSEHDDDDDDDYYDDLGDPLYFRYDNMYTYWEQYPHYTDWDSSGEEDIETIAKVKEPGQEGDVNKDDVIKVDVTSKEGAEKENINKDISTTEDDVIKGDVKSIDGNKNLDFENKDDGKKESEENIENKNIGILSDKLLKMEDEFLKKIEDSKETNLEKLKELKRKD